MNGERDTSYFEDRSCGRKKRYKTIAHAKADRRGMSERLHVYGPCEFCNGYHIGGVDRDNYDYREIDPRTGRYANESVGEQRKRRLRGVTRRNHGKKY